MPLRNGSFSTLYNNGDICSNTRYGPFVRNNSFDDMPSDVFDCTCFLTMTTLPGAKDGDNLPSLRKSMSRCRHSALRMVRKSRWRYRKGPAESK
jgi:hypothetical protein